MLAHSAVTRDRATNKLHIAEVPLLDIDRFKLAHHEQVELELLRTQIRDARQQIKESNQELQDLSKAAVTGTHRKAPDFDSGIQRVYRQPADGSLPLIDDPEAVHDRENGLRKPRDLYNFIKRSYQGLREPELSRLASKLHREAESILNVYGGRGYDSSR